MSGVLSLFSLFIAKKIRCCGEGNEIEREKLKELTVLNADEEKMFFFHSAIIHTFKSESRNGRVW